MPPSVLLEERKRVPVSLSFATNSFVNSAKNPMALLTILGAPNIVTSKNVDVNKL